MRQILMQARTGSWNYNLNDENSDEDFKIFVMPTFDDLYHNRQYNESSVTEKIDFSLHDIRKLSELLWKANINFIEALHSDVITFQEYNSKIAQIIAMKNELSKMNLPYLYNVCKRMFLEKMKRLDHATEGTEHLIEKYGYNTKEALHAYRMPDFLLKFWDTGFFNFKSAIWYEHQMKDFMLDIKHGNFSKEEFIEVANEHFYKMDKLVKEDYLNAEPNLIIRQKLENIIYRLVKENITGL